jgi:hypothetical protein
LFVHVRLALFVFLLLLMHVVIVVVTFAATAAAATTTDYYHYYLSRGDNWCGDDDVDLGRLGLVVDVTPIAASAVVVK